jgi:hypothetical protein
MLVTNEYENRHHYTERWELEEKIFCPGCGNKTVWVEQSPGDYYLGPDHYCTTCAHRFSLCGPTKLSQANELKILEQLRSGLTHEPTTRKGG